LTSGVSNAVQSLVEALALVIGIAIYSVPWARVRPRLLRRTERPVPVPSHD
jgi:hypothetical protein